MNTMQYMKEVYLGPSKPLSLHPSQDLPGKDLLMRYVKRIILNEQSKHLLKSYVPLGRGVSLVYVQTSSLNSRNSFSSMDSAVACRFRYIPSS